METTLLEEIDIRLERDPPSTEKLYVMEGNGTKRKDIERACQERDITSLVAHASSKGGFLEDELRRVACKSFAWTLIILNAHTRRAYAILRANSIGVSI